METFDRRAALGLMAAAAALSAGGRAFAAPAPATMWRDPGCGCCAGWARQVQAGLGVTLTIVDSPNLAAVKRARGVPADLRSCHTALISGFILEGHVPVPDIKRLIATRPKGVVGLAVPGMPMGSPGMETGGPSQPYRVFAFDRGGGRTLFSTHG